jgi:hypothetical protein
MSISERKGKEVQRAISAKEIEWQARFEELGEQVATHSEAGHLDAESITEVKTRITCHQSTTFPVRKKGVEATLLAPPPSPPTTGRHIRYPSPSPPPENNEEEERQSPLPQCRWYYAPE